MITCKIGENIINCYDGEYSKEQLKAWSSKNILRCPNCGGIYEYCHGEIMMPYFRHKDEDCGADYSETETNEHIQGKIQLYEWIKQQNGVTDVILEGWIPETKQRPDIMFKYDNKQYVIEYQCTPIATQYIERHSLYKAGGINDIWICGTEKYFGENKRMNTLEEYGVGIYYNPFEKSFIFGKSKIDVNFLKKMNKKNKLSNHIKLIQAKISKFDPFISISKDKIVFGLPPNILIISFISCNDSFIKKLWVELL